MKRFISVFAVAALLCQAALVFAQESDEPSIMSVLDAARAKYWQDKNPASDSQDSETQGPDGGPSAESAQEPVPYTPFLISVVPGVTVPFGYYDASFVGGPIGNISRDVTGAEGAGVFNIARDLRGFQAAGVFNLTRNSLGFQGAGVFNIAEEIHGFQGAGVFNIAGSVSGGQAAAVFNAADRVSGVQVGLVNVAGQIDGVQIGLVNIAGNGVNSISVTYEPQTDFTYAHMQAGTPTLFTIAGLGAPSGDWFEDFSGFVASVGLGSRTRAFGLVIDLDVSASQAIGSLPYGTFPASGDCAAWEGWDMIRAYPSVRLTAGIPLGRHLQVIGGVAADIDADSLGDRVPAALKAGDSWRAKLFGEGFTAYYKWFFGVKI